MRRRPRRRRAGAAAAFTLLLAIVAAPGRPLAYEAASTHAGLTGLAALHSSLHRFLRAMGLPLGLFQRLTLDARALDRREYVLLVRNLEKLDGAGGYRPDARLGQRAVGWLLAGAVLAELPASQDRHHFYSPALRAGLDNAASGAGGIFSVFSALEDGDTLRQFLTGTAFDLTGVSALRWIRHDENPQSVTRVLEHLVAAVRAPEAHARETHLVLALVGVGGLLHVLQDMAAPGHVRNDYLEGHLERLGGSPFDLGSAYERVVAEAYGQHGLPPYRGSPVRRHRVEEFFSNARWTGLADVTARSHFSAGTVPRTVPLLVESDPTELRQRLAAQLPLSEPPLAPFDLSCARRRVCYQQGRHGPQLAYTVQPNGTLRFGLDLRCLMATARHLLPLAAGYSSGLIDHLFRRGLELDRRGSEVHVRLQGLRWTQARLELLWEDASGRRRPLLGRKLRHPSGLPPELATFPLTLPTGARRLVALAEGIDLHGERSVLSASVWVASAAPGAAPRATP
ncbi:MAG: hypothetical protein IT371_17760 [Deltaproteobacteria bacterium]|nr:hypothetical protein [Deltaproteobacteria bacterium]